MERKNTPMSHREDAQLLARITDALRISQEKHCPRFVGFLDERQRMLAEREAHSFGHDRISFYGGYPEAERCLFGAFPDHRKPDNEEFPLAAMTVRFRRADLLTHRDFLGTLMSYGIERSTIGDILVEEGRAVFFVLRQIVPYVLDQMEKVGGTGIQVSEGAQTPFPEGRRFEPVEGTVASPRLDAVIAALLHVSREKGAAMIKSGLVQLCFEVTESVSAAVQAGNKISVRGYGRYMMVEVGSMTRKGRYRFLARKYI